MSGLLVLVVGPSGSGKDTLLAGAAAALQDDPRFVFARRTVTREAANEDHDTASVPAFLARQAAGDFAITWEAHGLHYGVPAQNLRALADGQTVVINVSRAVIAEVAARFPVAVVEITAPIALRSQRLADRHRETAADIAERLSREVPLQAERLHSIVNDGSIAEGIGALVRLLKDLQPALCR
ncbi:phosphonate metabolism protein/1,5-bisphosphokinase (PRPP-forming) PhnN [Acidisoma cellulosilytica]|uniref:Ribose 1,5-bisphosphate phosphokinase PhnN n=1 Tax=Acidisoma cellulosilyticum TaxID=2802395 RepID=A0A963Z105_9PROT|nr:phosphonate metabolism protein/1,5-bisphosphokinase (PRPP-forming) PhnN [Acidisoma cellulosilyticum]MCB8880556.1 phosphonate metabolism protein/1,5-bisphosphokinase (PRPP-forming) PhnN [Acidisoma cellulosilyticum]